MNWNDVGKGILKFAPEIGTALLGPAGGAIGALVSSALGVENTPDAVAQAVKNDPQAAVKLQQLQNTHAETMAKIQADAETAAIQSVNQTMQGETKSEHWPEWSWRPFWGFVSGLAFLAVCFEVGMLMYKAINAGQPQMMSYVPQVIGAYSTLFAIPGAILGVSAWHRGKMQRIQAGETATK